MQSIYSISESFELKQSESNPRQHEYVSVGNKRDKLLKKITEEDKYKITHTRGDTDAKLFYIWTTEKADSFTEEKKIEFRLNRDNIQASLFRNHLQDGYDLYHEYIDGKCRPYFDIEKRTIDEKEGMKVEKELIAQCETEFAKKYPNGKVRWFKASRWDLPKKEDSKTKQQTKKELPYKVSLHVIILGYYYNHPRTLIGYAQKLSMVTDNAVDLQVYSNIAANIRMVGSRKGSSSNDSALLRLVTEKDFPNWNPYMEKEYNMKPEYGVCTFQDCVGTIFDEQQDRLIIKDKITDYIVQHPNVCDPTELATMTLLGDEKDPHHKPTFEHKEASQSAIESSVIRSVKFDYSNVDPKGKLEIEKEQLEEMFMMLKPDQSVDMNKWMVNLFCMRNLSMRSGHDLKELAHKFSKQYYPAYDPMDVDNMFYYSDINRRYQLGVRCCGLKKLHDLCRETDQQKYKEIMTKYSKKKIIVGLPGTVTIESVFHLCKQENTTSDEIKAALRKCMIILRDSSKTTDFYVYREKMMSNNRNENEYRKTCYWELVRCEKGQLPYSSKASKIYIPALRTSYTYKEEIKYKDVALDELIVEMQKNYLFKEYNSIDFVPFLNEAKIDDTIFNTFKGYAYKQTKKELKEIDMKMIEPIRYHVAHILCGGGHNAERYREFVERWLAHLIQKPTSKFECPMWLAFISVEQGVGKNLYFDMIRSFIGSDYSVILSNLEQLTGSANLYIKEKVFGLIEEMSNGGSYLAKKADSNKLKGMISSDEIIIKELYKDAALTKNFMRCVCTSNHVDSLILEPGDRRWAVFECAGKQAPEYYDRLVATINDKKVLQEYFNYLTCLDISNFNPKVEAPKTDFHKKILLDSAPYPIQFLYRLAVSKELDLWKKLTYHTTKTHSVEIQNDMVPDTLITTSKKLAEIYRETYEVRGVYDFNKLESDFKNHIGMVVSKGADRKNILNGEGSVASKKDCYVYSLEQLGIMIQKRLHNLQLESKSIDSKDKKDEKDVDDISEEESNERLLLKFIETQFRGDLSKLKKVLENLEKKQNK